MTLRTESVREDAGQPDVRVTLAGRLRTETAPHHREAEHALGLPGSVRSRSEYAALLTGLLSYHLTFEDIMRWPAWAGGWMTLGITPSQHERSQLLIDDLHALGEPAVTERVSLSPVPNFARALGALYVVEGSSLGGRFLAPMFREILGDVPTAFYESAGRQHPHPWQSVQRALSKFDESSSEADEVVAGARDAFTSFGRALNRVNWQE